jgi:hypothetical protein
MLWPRVGTGSGRTPSGKGESYRNPAPESSLLNLIPKTGTSGEGAGGKDEG